MSSYDPDLICTREDDVLILTLNRGSKANSLTPALVEDLITALDQPDNVRMAVIRGEGKHFCAGYLDADAQLTDAGTRYFNLMTKYVKEVETI